MTEKQRQHLANQLREAILASGLTLYELGERSGVHRSQISRFMKGTRDLGLLVADKLCRVLGLQFTGQGVVKPADRTAEAQDAGQLPPGRAPRKRSARAPKK